MIVSTKTVSEVSTSLLAAYSFEKEEPKNLKSLDELSDSQTSNAIKAGEFSGKEGETLLLHCKGKAKRLLLLGLGKREEFTAQKLRSASGKATAQAKKLKQRELALSLDVHLPISVYDASQAAIEGAFLATYSFDKYKTEKKEGESEKIEVGELTLLATSSDARAVENGAGIGTITGECQNLARAMCNEPPNNATPSSISKNAEQLAKQYGLKAKIFSASDLKKMNMNALLAVASGSVQEPKMVVLEYFGGKDKICLVGKGITFDSGGISLKPGKDMEKMKFDKSGAIDVIAAAVAAARLKLPLHIIAIAPLTENVPSGSAYKPADIITTSTGKTIEIQNTDAEGRVILADALAYASSLKPNAIIDLATLTGACVVALGSVAAGIMGNDEKLIEKIKKAGSESGEKVWQFPMWKEYDELVKSDVADVKNVGTPGQAGTIAGAKLLEKFVSSPWVHIDIAGVSDSDREKPEFSKGATGYGVRLLTRLLQTWKK